MVCEKKSIFQKRSFRQETIVRDRSLPLSYAKIVPVGRPENEINDSTGPAGVRADFAVPLCRK